MSAYADILRPQSEDVSFLESRNFSRITNSRNVIIKFLVCTQWRQRKERWLRCIHFWSRHYAQFSCKLRIPAALYPETQAGWLFATACLVALD